MNNRSAGASIKGYDYQFLHTIIDILECDSDTYECTVEGIEDFDIEKDAEKDLIQYKYHEEQKFTNSKVAKPISLMFKHFLNNQNEFINYKLFIYLKDENLDEREVTVTSITDILKIKESREILSDTTTAINKEEIDDLYEMIEKFIQKFSWKSTKNYNDLQNSIINSFETDFSLTMEESKIIYLANAMRIINYLAIQSEEVNRKITKRDFLSKLDSYKDNLYTSFLLRNKGFNELSKIIKKKKNILNIKKDTSNYVLQVNNINRDRINNLIISIVNKFTVKGNKSTYKPLTIIINCEFEKYKNFKKELYKYIFSLNQLLIINDGIEDYKFNADFFNSKLLMTKNKAGNKFNRLNFNFRLIHQLTYNDHKDEIKLSNASLFILDSSESNISELSEKKFYLNNLNNEELLELIGE